MGTRVKAAIRKCLSCDRWSGVRQLSADRRTIEHEDQAHGECIGGPWHGTQRETISACGRWIAWAALKTPKAH
jgi:hypothetical protein